MLINKLKSEREIDEDCTEPNDKEFSNNNKNEFMIIEMNKINNNSIKKQTKKIMNPVWYMIKQARIQEENKFEEIYQGGEKERKNKRSFCEELFSTEEISYTNKDFKNMSEEEQQDRIIYLWQKARSYVEKLCLKVRLQKMQELNMKEKT